MDDVLRTRGLTKSFGSTRANDGIDLAVRPGEVVGLLGHNGAGKTTFVSQTAGLVKPDEGTLQVAGEDVKRRPGVARRALALQPQAQVPLEGLTPTSAIEIAARLRGSSRSTARRAAKRLIDQLDIGPWARQRAGTEGSGLSGGVRRLTAFAMAVVAPVPLVILDEPTNDIDASRRRLLWAMARRVADAGAGVLLVTHNVSEAESVVDRLVILDRGRVVAAGTPDQLRGPLTEGLRLDLWSAGEDSSLHPPFETMRIDRTGHRTRVQVPHHAVEQAMAWANRFYHDGVIEQFALTPMSLEDVYLAITSHQAEVFADVSAAAQGAAHV